MPLPEWAEQIYLLSGNCQKIAAGREICDSDQAAVAEAADSQSDGLESRPPTTMERSGCNPSVQPGMAAMATVLLDQEIEIPTIRDLAEFRRWALSDEFPQRGPDRLC
jgi:hypothetical protein